VIARQKKVLKDLIASLPRFEYAPDEQYPDDPPTLMCTVRGEFLRYEDVIDAIRSSHSNE
jgi:hypothetical protein